MRRLFLALTVALVAAAPAVAQEGAIAVGTPITFVAPPTITGYELDELTLRPGPNAMIRVVLVAREQPDIKLLFEYPRDCGSFGTTNGKPNPPTCPARDTSAEIHALILTMNGLNYQTRSMWRRVFDNLCVDFPFRFPGGCIVQ